MKDYIYSVGETVFESFCFGCLLVDAKGRIRFTNKALADMLNWSVQELKELSIDDFLNQEDKKKAHKAIIDFLNKGIRPPRTWTFYTRLNKPVAVSVGAKPATIKNEKLACLLVKNITEKVMLENVVREKNIELEEVLRQSDLAIKTAGLGIWKYVIDTKELFWNNVMFDIYEMDPTDFKGCISDFNHMLHPEDLELAKQNMKRAVSGEQILNSTFRIITNKKNLKYICASGTPVFNERGAVKEVIGVNIDITKIKENELELVRHKEQIQSITDNIPGLVLKHVLHPDGTDEAIYISRRVHNFYGFKPEEVLKDFSLIWNQVLPQDVKLLKNNIRYSAKNLSFWSHKFRVKDRFGTIRWLQGMGNPKERSNGDIEWDSIFLDVTKLEEYRINLESSLEEREVLLQEIHHRVKNNLAIVCGLLELQIMKSGDTSSNQLKDARNRIQTIALVHEQLYSGMRFNHIDIEEYFKNLLNNLQKTTLEPNTKVSFYLKFKIDSLNINQAIPLGLLTSELFTNSVKHAFDRKKNFIRLHINKEGDLIEVFYKDSGKGYNESEINKKSLGNELIITLLEQLNADYSIVTDGTFELCFSFAHKTKGAHSNLDENQTR